MVKLEPFIIGNKKVSINRVKTPQGFEYTANMKVDNNRFIQILRARAKNSPAFRKRLKEEINKRIVKWK